jgi:hypothetical protein
MYNGSGASYLTHKHTVCTECLSKRHVLIYARVLHTPDTMAPRLNGRFALCVLLETMLHHSIQVHLYISKQ